MRRAQGLSLLFGLALLVGASPAKGAEPVPPSAKPAPTARSATTTEPPREAESLEQEDPNRTYLFIGLRYRGTVIPKFLINAFVDEGKTIFSHSVGAELDIRKNGFSFVPALQFSEYGTGDVLFKEKGKEDIASNYTVVSSSMKALYATVDLLWSKKLAQRVELEFGLGFGVGLVFGDLTNNWVREDPNGALGSATGKRFSPCASAASGPGCTLQDHQNTDIAKVGGYAEPSWFSGGKRPSIFPWLSIPQIGLRIQPAKSVVARVGVGLSLTGFWFGLNGGYGLPSGSK